MLNQLYGVVTPWAKSNKFQIIKNRVIGRLANYCYPVYCFVSPPRKSNAKANEICGDSVIISLTSFPGRIDKVYLCINSLLRQSVRADKIILWLAKEQFPSGNIPKKLSDLINEQFEIRYCDDLKSYKKIFYTAQEYKDDVIITVDDDTLYPEDWLVELVKTYQSNRDKVCCYRAHKMTLENGHIGSYSSWVGLSPDEVGPSRLLVPIGVGGVLYPPHYFDAVEFDFSLIREMCPTADDLWLKAIGLKNGYEAVKVYPNSKEWFTIKSSQRESVMQSNVGKNLNDVSMKNLEAYFGFKF